MDIAYDHIQEEALSPEEAARKTAEDEQARQNGLNTEFQEAYKSFTASPWGARLGGFFSDVKKQSTTFYDEASKEASAASTEAMRGFTGLRESLVSHARSMSGGANDGASTTAKVGESIDDGKEHDSDTTVQDGESVISRFRSEATKRLKDLEKAEEAADAAIFKFGANIGNFLKDAVKVAPPTEEQMRTGKLLFESKDQDGKRVIHSTRFDAQLHAIHVSSDSFIKDPVSDDFEPWKAEFDIEQKTDSIAQDLEKYEELRRSMEKLVPEKVEYTAFWTRYYFLRMIVESEEARRREILKGAAQSTADDAVGWDDEESDDEGGQRQSTPQQKATTSTIPETASVKTLTPSDKDARTPTQEPSSASTDPATASTLKPNEPRRSQDQHSQPDSDGSYDLVSGATSRTPGSPREGSRARGGVDDDEEEDWE